jgi:hypothetical protein
MMLFVNMEDPMQQSTDVGFAIHKKAKRGAKCHVIRDKLTRERHLLFFAAHPLIFL